MRFTDRGPLRKKLLEHGPILDAFDHRFTTRTIKVIFDGSLGSRSAALLETLLRRGDLRFF